MYRLGCNTPRNFDVLLRHMVVTERIITNIGQQIQNSQTICSELKKKEGKVVFLPQDRE